ncbi:MAG: cytochrome c [Rhodobiaceae bacterium]|nr:cytochrome c [Rhodobiaceae bacterium]
MIPSMAYASDYSKLSGDELASFVKQDCGSCHGMTLKGGLGRPLTTDRLSGFDVETLKDVVLNGVPGTAMPPWAGILTPDQAEWIARNLKEGTLQ